MSGAAGFCSKQKSAYGIQGWVGYRCVLSASTSGDGNYNNNTSTCPDANELVTITTQTPPVTTQATPQSGTGSEAHTAGLQSHLNIDYGLLPTKTMTFTLCTDNTCTTAATVPTNPSAALAL